jgi:hypothetical protein
MRFDLVFSYWIFAWYIIYMLNLTKYNPKLAIGLGIIENTLLLIAMILFGSNMRTILYFVFVNTLIKIIPFYTLRNKIAFIKDIVPTTVLFLIYFVWVFINKKDLTGSYKMVFDSLIHNRNETPFLQFVDYLKFRYKLPIP